MVRVRSKGDRASARAKWPGLLAAMRLLSILPHVRIWKCDFLFGVAREWLLLKGARPCGRRHMEEYDANCVCLKALRAGYCYNAEAGLVRRLKINTIAS